MKETLLYLLGYLRNPLSQKLQNTSPREFLYLEQRKVLIPGTIMIHADQGILVVGKAVKVMEMVRCRH
jgi:hypothetical protein